MKIIFDYVDYLNECFIDNENIYINDILIFNFRYTKEKNVLIMGKKYDLGVFLNILIFIFIYFKLLIDFISKYIIY